jgi:hypothetical protein
MAEIAGVPAMIDLFRKLRRVEQLQRADRPIAGEAHAQRPRRRRRRIGTVEPVAVAADRADPLQLVSGAQRVNVVVAPDALRRIRAEYAVDAPAVGVAQRHAGNRPCRHRRRVERLVVMPPADRPDPALVVIVDRLTTDAGLDLTDRLPAEHELVEQHVFGIGDHRKRRLAVHSIVEALAADGDDRLALGAQREAGDRTRHRAGANAQRRGVGVARQSVLVDELIAIADVGIGIEEQIRGDCRRNGDTTDRGRQCRARNYFHGFFSQVSGVGALTLINTDMTDGGCLAECSSAVTMRSAAGRLQPPSPMRSRRRRPAGYE